MNDLRNQLDSAKQEYRSQRYPGDLASELLPSKGRLPALTLFIGAGSAIAAAIVLVVLMRPAVTPPPAANPEIVQSDTPSIEEDDAVLVTELASVPEFPEDLSMAPAAETSESDDLSFAPSFPSIELGSMPSIPSMDFSFSDIETSETSKEST